MEERNEYWMCIIGPTKRSEHPGNGEGPLRQAVELAFYRIFGRDADICASGFGLTEEEKRQIEKIKIKAFLERSKTNSTIGA